MIQNSTEITQLEDISKLDLEELEAIENEIKNSPKVVTIVQSQSKTPNQSKDPLHGKSLQSILEYLVDIYGWDNLADKVNINCFAMNPSIKSSLTFLRKTSWARTKVESLYVYTLRRNK